MLISLSNLNKIKQHAKESFPEECCGLLIGEYEEQDGLRRNIIRGVAPCVNRYRGDKTQGFEIATYQSYDIEMAAREYGLRTIGSYHSHTSVGAFPSAADCDFTGVYQTMLILSLKMGLVEQVRAYQKNQHREICEEFISFVY